MGGGEKRGRKVVEVFSALLRRKVAENDPPLEYLNSSRWNSNAVLATSLNASIKRCICIDFWKKNVWIDLPSVSFYSKNCAIQYSWNLLLKWSKRERNVWKTRRNGERRKCYGETTSIYRHQILLPAASSKRVTTLRWNPKLASE